MSDILSLYICNIGILEISNANRSDINSPSGWIEENRLEVRLKPFRENYYLNLLISFDTEKALKASSKNEAKIFRKICLFLADNDVSFTNKIWLEPIEKQLKCNLNVQREKPSSVWSFSSFSILEIKMVAMSWKQSFHSFDFIILLD